MAYPKISSMKKSMQQLAKNHESAVYIGSLYDGRRREHDLINGSP